MKKSVLIALGIIAVVTSPVWLSFLQVAWLAVTGQSYN